MLDFKGNNLPIERDNKRKRLSEKERERERSREKVSEKQVATVTISVQYVDEFNVQQNFATSPTARDIFGKSKWLYSVYPKEFA